MEPLIRLCEPCDLAACRDLWAELTQRHRDIYNDPTIGGDDPGVYFDTYLASPGLRGPWVAVVDGAVAGLTGLLPHWGDLTIEPIVVSAGLRSRGIGAALVVHAVEQARAGGARDVTVRPVARNIEAIAFFVRGFDVTRSTLSLTSAARRPTTSVPASSHGHGCATDVPPAGGMPNTHSRRRNPVSPAALRPVSSAPWTEDGRLLASPAKKSTPSTGAASARVACRSAGGRSNPCGRRVVPRR
jgi:GNAT superfamily N-acetyltransferase